MKIKDFIFYGMLFSIAWHLIAAIYIANTEPEPKSIKTIMLSSPYITKKENNQDNYSIDVKEFSSQYTFTVNITRALYIKLREDFNNNRKLIWLKDPRFRSASEPHLIYCLIVGIIWFIYFFIWMEA